MWSLIIESTKQILIWFARLRIYKNNESSSVYRSINSIKNEIDILCELNPFINYWKDFDGYKTWYC